MPAKTNGRGYGDLSGMNAAPVMAHDSPLDQSRESSDRTLFIEPTEEILLLGLLQRDARTIEDMLKGLPRSDAEYRSNLRVIVSTAQNLRVRAAKLLGEVVR